jgi:hypothetical protein
MKRPAVVALLVLAVAACGETVSPTPETRRPFEWSALPGGWTALEDPPFARARAAAVWTGSELFYWGGDTNYGGTAHSDGALFDPATRSWRPIAAAPIQGRSSPAAVWTGTEVLIWGGWSGVEAKADGAAYDPSADTWRPLPESPLSGRDPVAAVWTGAELIVWGDVSRRGGDVEGAAYDPASDSWRELLPAPFALNEADAVWTGTEMIVYGALLDGNNWSETEHARGLAYDPAEDRWRKIAGYPLSPQASAIVWSGREMVAWDYELAAGAYEPSSDTWRELPDLPLEFSECYPAGGQGGDVVLAWHCGRAAMLELAESSWRVVPSPVDEIFGLPIAAGSVFLFAGAPHEGHKNALWAYRPEGDTSFVPPAADEGERTRLPLVFPNGQRIVVSYPRYLDLAGLGVQPDVSYLYLDDPPSRFPLTFVRGEATPGPSEVALRAGRWTVLAPLRDPAEKEIVAQSLQLHETSDEFPVVEALPPLGLSDEFGEGGGSMLAFGDLEPKPNVVSSLEPLIELAPVQKCRLSQAADEVEISHSHGARCLGDFYLGVYGADRPYIEAVLEGLRLEEG